MSTADTASPQLRISGDMLALDPRVREQIEKEAERLGKRYPATAPTLRVEIGELFDPGRGHRVRCELTIALPGRRELLIREVQKGALDAISGAFAAARRQLRRPRTRKPATPSPTPGGLRPIGP
jgi:ribosome-associated translation inhibitor RaiA